MNAERHQQVKVVFNAVRELPEQERQGFLEKACGEDAELLGEVRSLLEYDDAPTQPALQTRVPENLAKGAQAVGLPSLLHRTIGDFRIQRVIASGGMGTVYEAWQEPPRRKVALKALRRGLRSASSLRRFEYESEILGRLRHPGVAQVYGAGTFAEGEENVPYFVMEFIEGAMSITEYARRHEMSIEDRLDLFVKVCDAVHHAHQKGIIHRDLKPGNILVDSSGQPKIIDFGVARITDGELEAATLHTSAGEVLGTLAYMSPEQTTMGSTGTDDASEVDTRSDIYSLGVVLYELLTSSAPLTMSGDATFSSFRGWWWRSIHRGRVPA